ncbi:unnamed protein product [Anisakis simplex]|uniref:LITAF domain-containing protein n=1 Tax=Anisakis simplex TaxID=6269 RepID=A0A0M3JT16_ANISI|nr:unnamed protein product [Anisakis simplex]
MAEPPPAYDAVTSPYAANNMNTVKECEVTYQQRPASEQRPGNEPSAPNYAAATAANTTTTSAPPPPATTVYVNTLVYGEFPIRMCCRYCNADILTKTTYQAGLLTWLLCGGLALFGFIPFTCLILYN